MTDEELDELIRWAAEEVLGWDIVIGEGTPISPLRKDLLGWPGFGLAVEAARERYMEMELHIGHWSDWEPYNKVVLEGVRFPEYSYDPAIAAWKAMRRALDR